jgi:hypothetical protein
MLNRTVMDWLHKHRFWLLESGCNEINRLWKLSRPWESPTAGDSTTRRGGRWGRCRTRRGCRSARPTTTPDALPVLLSAAASTPMAAQGAPSFALGGGFLLFLAIAHPVVRPRRTVALDGRRWACAKAGVAQAGFAQRVVTPTQIRQPAAKSANGGGLGMNVYCRAIAALRRR